MSGGLKEKYDKIIESPFLEGNSSDAIVDIVTQYEWVTNKPKSVGGGKIAPCPFVYAIEYKQRYGATATNLYNNIYAIKNVGNNIIENSGNAVNVVYNKIKETLGTIFSGTFSVNANKLDPLTKMDTVDKSKLGVNFTKDKGYLSPYQYLYVLDKTDKKFCFPFLGETAASLSISNDFSSSGSTSVISKGISGAIDSIADGLVSLAGDIQDITNFVDLKTTGQAGSFVMYNIEKAKAFSFPTTGKTISVKFPLYNTTKKDAWKDNYRFIMLFALRNMLFRVTNVEYYPPLIYDVSIPGWGRMPLSYVRQFSVKPVGMVRTLQMKSFIGEGKNITVNVPEGWIVQIDFMSLVADSANQVLSSIEDLPITATMINYE